MSERGGVVYIGSFSKSIAPALRVGYIVAPWEVMSRTLALKTDGGSGALEQMVLAEYCIRNFSKHVPEAAARSACQARRRSGIAAGALRSAVGVRRSEGRHLPVGVSCPTASMR
jgi:DNA-binding transcriptional MocR family regulator